MMRRGYSSSWMMKYQGVIFDFNGVLLDDAGFQIEAWQQVARQLRGREMTAEELAVHMHGRPNSYVLSYLAGRKIAAPELLTLIQAKETLYRELCLSNPGGLQLSPGARELLDTLVARSIPRNIATSSERTNLDFFVKHLALARWFEIAKIVYDDGRRPGKPAPDMYLAAAHNIQIPPKECMVVEDAVSGLQAARAAGIGYIIGIGAPDVQARLLACDGVSAVIESLAEFPRERLASSPDAR
jgi:HAD superfamily hydrolase (TIGR01509 family)